MFQGQPQGDSAAHAGAAEVGFADAFGVEHFQHGIGHQADGEAFAVEQAFAVSGQVGNEDAVTLCEGGDLRLPLFAGHAAAVQEDDGLRGFVAVGLVVDHGSSFFSR